MSQEWVSFFLKFFVGYVLIRSFSMALGILYEYYRVGLWDTVLYLAIFTYGLFFVYGRIGRS
ncbi:hypothetical protein [Brevibacillus fulvus]|uniref:Uncharacterized protein n=1 Tax=Brevibacillus fulvus TaxID=1125967 RepID=A0A938Y018_9BACL|nr:hypothetical protein [Brevibacillus fulvus]MBM7589062.1 hypothetical protein [Brevibacillus fulvus]